MALLGVDIGSSGVRAVAFDVDGAELTQAQASYDIDTSVPGRVEVDPDAIWQAFRTSVRTAADAVGADEVQAVGLSSHGETFFLADRDGRPLSPGIMNADNRAAEQSNQLEARLGRSTIYAASGAPPHPMFPLAKLTWLREHAPQTLRRAGSILCVADMLLVRMGLSPRIDPSLASRTQLFDVRKRRWSPQLCDAAGLDPAQLSEVVFAESVAGEIPAPCARDLHLPEGTPIVMGGHDQPCASLGLGVCAPGIMGDVAGTYECLSISNSAPQLDGPAVRASLNSYCHVVPGQYITLAFFPSGVMMRWFLRDLCGVSEARLADVHEEMEALAKDDESHVRVTPYLVGACNPHWDPGATASIAGLTLSSTRASIYRGILDGIVEEFVANLSVLEELAGPVRRVHMSGGQTRSALGVDLRAKASGRQIRLLRTEQASCLGAAMLAGIGAGIHPSFDAAAKCMVHYDRDVGDAAHV